MSAIGTVRNWRRRRAVPPRLSVVVPVYNVEPYVGDCLTSLRAQTYADFEAVVVLDGATDGSDEVVKRHAAADPRIRVISQPNSGLGAARNTGAAASDADYLTFLDADDTLPVDAYSVLMSTIERTGSDLAAGTLVRDTGQRRQAMRLMQENHRTRRERVSLSEMPLMLADVFAVNKVFRRSFWDEAGLAFPERLRYEDQPTLTRAFLACDRFDVVPETVYHWRVRDDSSSITQKRHELADLVDRMESKRVSTTDVLASGMANVVDTWFREILPVDMWEYFRAAPEASEEYWSALESAVREFWNGESVPFEHTRLPVQQRMMGWLVGQGRRAELADLLTFVDECRGRIPLEERRDGVVALLPGIDDPARGLPEAAYTLGEHERR